MPKTTNSVIADLIQARKEKGISQFGMALRLGVTPARIAAIEHSDNIEVKIDQRIAKELDCNIIVIRGPQWEETKK